MKFLAKLAGALTATAAIAVLVKILIDFLYDQCGENYISTQEIE